MTGIRIDHSRVLACRIWYVFSGPTNFTKRCDAEQEVRSSYLKTDMFIPIIWYARHAQADDGISALPESAPREQGGDICVRHHDVIIGTKPSY